MPSILRGQRCFISSPDEGSPVGAAFLQRHLHYVKKHRLRLLADGVNREVIGVACPRSLSE
jgi:hypothetical protein